MPTEPGVDTPSFLLATEDLVRLFGALMLSFRRLAQCMLRASLCTDLLGSAAFKVVQSDLTGNIEVRLLTEQLGE